MIIHGKDHGGMDESDMVSITCKSFKLQCDLYPLHLISFHCLIQFHVHCAYRVRPFHTSAKLIEIKFKFLQPKHGPHGTVKQMASNETPHTPWGLEMLIAWIVRVGS